MVKNATPNKKGKASKSSAPKKQKPPLDAVFLNKLLKKGCKKQVLPLASIFLEGVLQYVGAEVLELSYLAALSRQEKTSKKGALTITGEDIKAAVESDEELQYLIKTKPLPKKASKSKENDASKSKEKAASKSKEKAASKSKEKATVITPMETE